MKTLGTFVLLVKILYHRKKAFACSVGKVNYLLTLDQIWSNLCDHIQMPFFQSKMKVGPKSATNIFLRVVHGFVNKGDMLSVTTWVMSLDVHAYQIL